MVSHFWRNHPPPGSSHCFPSVCRTPHPHYYSLFPIISQGESLHKPIKTKKSLYMHLDRESSTRYAVSHDFPVLPKPPAPAAGGRKLLRLHHGKQAHRQNHQLGNALSRLDGIRLFPVILQRHHQFSPVVAVNHAHTAGQGNPVLDAHAAAGEHQPHAARRDLRRQPGGKGKAVPRLQHHRLLDASAQVIARAARCLPLGKLGLGPQPFHP